ncbi:hypothetical protein [Haloarchaeobius sp. DYHT-AS-18]|uniref:hypothetical protein n=1 Tax=Haloarchaeobius sp. DYHT-AS-18 TaxID=3446117 RepID=UPI003EBAEB9C
MTEVANPTLLLAFVAGLFVPFGFAMERLRGFGRHIVAKLPYRPPKDSEKCQEQ